MNELAKYCFLKTLLEDTKFQNLLYEIKKMIEEKFIDLKEIDINLELDPPDEGLFVTMTFDSGKIYYTNLSNIYDYIHGPNKLTENDVKRVLVLEAL